MTESAPALQATPPLPPSPSIAGKPPLPTPPLPGMPGYIPVSSLRERLIHYAAPVGVLLVALIALYLLRKRLKRLWQYITINKSKVVWWITAVIIALQLFNPPNMPWTPGVIGNNVDSFQLLVRIIGISILGFIIANQVK